MRNFFLILIFLISFSGCIAKPQSKFELFIQNNLQRTSDSTTNLRAYFFYDDGGGCNACLLEYQYYWKEVVNNKKYSFNGVFISPREYTQKAISKQLGLEISQLSFKKSIIDEIPELNIMPVIAVVNGNGELVFFHIIGKVDKNFPGLNSEQIISKFKNLYNVNNGLRLIDSIKIEERENLIFSANTDIRIIDSGFTAFDSKSMKLVTLSDKGKIKYVNDLQDKNNIISTITQLHEVLVCKDTFYCMGIELPGKVEKGEINFPIPTIYAVVKNKILAQYNIKHSSIMPPLINTHKGIFFKIFDWSFTDSNKIKNNIPICGFVNSKAKKIELGKYVLGKDKGSVSFDLAEDVLRYENDSCIYRLGAKNGLLSRIKPNNQVDELIKENKSDNRYFLDFLIGEDKKIYVVTADTTLKNYFLNIYNYNCTTSEIIALPSGFKKLISVDKNSILSTVIIRETGIYIDKYSN